MKLRIKFSKIGPLKFIGHLDIMRYFQKAVKRADIDIKYTEGFSPHQIMSFAFPMGIGLEGLAEYFDIEVNSYDDLEKMKKDLDAQMAYGMKIEDIILLPDNAENAMASVQAAGYIIRFNDNPEFSVDDAISKYEGMTEILFTKKTKKSEKTIDIKPFIYRICKVEDVEAEILNNIKEKELSLSDSDFFCLVNASSSGNLNPKEVVKCLYDLENVPYIENYSLLRTDLYTVKDGNYVSLGEKND